MPSDEADIIYQRFVVIIDDGPYLIFLKEGGYMRKRIDPPSKFCNFELVFIQSCADLNIRILPVGSN